ncbi:hypothetical protein QG044_10005 [Kingella kingae]|uniref:Uncharacterized protein n=2 Tax=Kingella kingae TaxID=504 RepID=F5S807_KINKI|nr:hypothetical protein [Kingella kingae]EGK08328.1 hypothetical protein HMPREF0476_1340 [Kingella kingae ATCC 23330]MDK4534826.1 hypothetical protein [Kingella kingae]MDK4541287.1 hypothetical protein [Kingella kingae]MDK4553841.1 hypothetical protein [Kingella kingae]MDK4576674.1 hypothetical protein [Kingella kingae]
MYDIPPAHLPADFAESNLSQNLYIAHGDTVYLSDVFVLNNAAILEISRVADMLATLGYCISADDKHKQALLNTLQLAAELLERTINPTHHY